METIFTDLQSDLVEYLKADEYLSDVVVLNERTADILSEVNNALSLVTEKSSKIGLAAIVLQIVGTAEYPGIQFSPLTLGITVRVLEDPVVNNHSNKTAFSIARRIADILSQFSIVGRVSHLIPQNPTIAPAQDQVAPVAYEVNFQGREIDSTKRDRVAMPSITPPEGATPQTVTLTTATAGAQIYYTTDGSFPRQGNASALLYTAPINLAAAATLRAAAYKSGSIGSSVNQAKYT